MGDITARSRKGVLGVLIVPRNWSEFQHYTARNPPWIKLHRKLLDDFEFQSLPVESRALAPMLWLIASDNERGEINAAPGKLAFRLRAEEHEITAALEPLLASGFFVCLQSASVALAVDASNACSETEERRDRDRGEARAREFPVFWKAYPRKEAKKDAEVAWRKVTAPLDVLLAAIERQAASEAWQRSNGQFIPLPATWLRGQRWEDAGTVVPRVAPFRGPDPALEKIKADAAKAAPMPEVVREKLDALKGRVFR